jgi:hypothetical protein
MSNNPLGVIMYGVTVHPNAIMLRHWFVRAEDAEEAKRKAWAIVSKSAQTYWKDEADFMSNVKVFMAES